MAPVTLQDILGCVDSTIKRWEYPFEETEAAKSWRAWGNDTVQKSFVRQCALNILQRQWVDGELEPEYLRVNAVCALLEAMARKPKKVVKKTGPDLRHRALMRQTLKSMQRPVPDGRLARVRSQRDPLLCQELYSTIERF